MKSYVFRLKPGVDLRKEIEKYSKEKEIKAGVIIACVGSLTKAVLRLAEDLEVKEFNKGFEIVSLVGTISQDGMHLHLSISDKEGGVIGGHLKNGCIIHTTAEIVIGELENWELRRKEDSESGFKELVAKRISQK